MKKNDGFTLIEVLVALVILAIAMTAIIKATSANSRNLAYLEEKTLADWTAMNIYNEIRVGKMQAHNLDAGAQSGTSMMLNHIFWWQARLQDMPEMNATEIIIAVRASKDQPPILNLTGYMPSNPNNS